MRYFIAKVVWIIIIVLYLFFLFLRSCGAEKKPEEEHMTEGEYLVNIINSDQNRYVDEENYFYKGSLCVRCYSLKDGSIKYYANEKGYRMEDFAVWAGDIYYVRSDDAGFELWKQNVQTDEKTLILSREDIESLNGGEKLDRGSAGAHKDYCIIDVYEDYMFFMISGDGEREYISPIEGDFMQECIDISTLFQEDNTSGEIQRVVYDGITIERCYSSRYEQYETIGIRDKDGHKILYNSSGTGIQVGDKIVRFSKDSYADEFKYRIGGGELRTITCLKEKKLKRSDIYEKYLTVEDGKIIGWLSVSRHPNVSWDLEQDLLEKDILFELDIETGGSQILYDTGNNLEKIIGYQDGVIYFAGNDTVYSRELDSGQQKVLFDLPGGQDYVIDWQAGYLIIYDKVEVEEVTAYQISEDRLVGGGEVTISQEMAVVKNLGEREENVRGRKKSN
ncbi:MAG: hypothetical protein NC429_13880 [Lachnospiraceae bacterium]|nr:hypothetical protein [Lachnospiraceae bacterium]